MTNLHPVQGLSDEKLSEIGEAVAPDALQGDGRLYVTGERTPLPFKADTLHALVSELQHRRAYDGGVVDQKAIWLAAHKVAEKEYPRIVNGICQQPGLAGALALFAISFAASPPITPANIEHVEGEVVDREAATTIERLTALVARQAEALNMIADIAEGSTTVNSLRHIAKIARSI